MKGNLDPLEADSLIGDRCGIDATNPFDEGLGTVYERFMLNRFFENLTASVSIRSVLEVPVFGMSGLTGINSVVLAQRGCRVTLVDPDAKHLNEANSYWRLLPVKAQCKTIHQTDPKRLPFENNRFDLVWNFAALWHAKDVGALLSEIARVSAGYVVIMIPNRIQVGYFFRKYLLQKDFFDTVDETWNDMRRIRSCLTAAGLHLEKEGILDCPPWPDTCLPIGKLLEKLKLKKGRNREQLRSWNWEIMSHYRGTDPDLRQKVERFAFIEDMPVAWQIKALWAHHRYVIFSKPR